MTIIDIIAAINLVLSCGSFFIAAGIIMSLKEGGYILAKGWKYVSPAILFFTVTKSIDFFYEYGVFSYPRLLRESILVVFSVLIFIGLLVQYLAIKEALSSRTK